MEVVGFQVLMELVVVQVSVVHQDLVELLEQLVLQVLQELVVVQEVQDLEEQVVHRVQQELQELVVVLEVQDLEEQVVVLELVVHRAFRVVQVHQEQVVVQEFQVVVHPYLSMMRVF